MRAAGDVKGNGKNEIVIEWTEKTDKIRQKKGQTFYLIRVYRMT